MYRKIFEALQIDEMKSLPIDNNNNSSSSSSSSSGSSGSCILDICCGTGTIGICALKNNFESSSSSSSSSSNPLLIGIELCPSAIENSKVNAQLNNIVSSFQDNMDTKNNFYAEFICSRAEHVLTSILNFESFPGMPPNMTQIIRDKKLIAIVDPPREVYFNLL